MKESVIDAGRPCPARMHDHLLGGEDNFTADREAAGLLMARAPDLAVAARESRAFLRRAVAKAARLGIRQFLDLGAGLPTMTSTHAVARHAAPGAWVAYVDHDPRAVSHAKDLLAGSGDSSVLVLDGDLRSAAVISILLDGHIDFGSPVAVILSGVLHLLPGSGAREAVRGWMDRVVPGSVLILSHATADGMTPAEAEAAAGAYAEEDRTPAVLRSRGQIRKFFTGLDMVRPGLTPVGAWDAEPREGRPLAYGGVAVKGGLKP